MKKRFIVFISLLLITGLSFFAYQLYIKNKKEIRELDEFVLLSYNTLNEQEQLLESYGSSVKIIWYNAIYKIKNENYNQYLIDENGTFNSFEVAIKNYAIAYKEKILSLKDAKEKIDDGMRVLKDEIDRLSYDSKRTEYIEKMYVLYSKLYDLIFLSSESYNDYASEFDDIVKEYKDIKNDASIYMPVV